MTSADEVQESWDTDDNHFWQKDKAVSVHTVIFDGI